MKLILRIISICALFYLLVCVFLYFYQEHLIFLPKKVEKEYVYRFDGNYEELNIPAKDGQLLNGLLFKADSSRGLIFYLHGNAGSLAGWGNVASTYTAMHFDVFIFDYRGFGKSEGKIESEAQFFDDVQYLYYAMKKRYGEDSIIVLGYSIGTGPAARLASQNHPKGLILQAPYYDLTDMMRNRYPGIPLFLLKYPFATPVYLKQCKMPVLIFHGDNDRVIDHSASSRLKALFKKGDTLIILEGQGHLGITDNPDYQAELLQWLSR